LNKWYIKKLQGIECRTKSTLSITDCDNALRSGMYFLPKVEDN
jgi:hypothetical protein